MKIQNDPGEVRDGYCVVQALLLHESIRPKMKSPEEEIRYTIKIQSLRNMKLKK